MNTVMLTLKKSCQNCTQSGNVVQEKMDYLKRTLSGKVRWHAVHVLLCCNAFSSSCIEKGRFLSGLFDIQLYIVV